MSDARPVRRQERGLRRIAEILDAALALFAEVGFEAATTNAIAARAGISPGSLYQFFANKEAIAEALSVRLVEALREAHGSAFDMASVADMPLSDLLDRMLDPLIAFHVANPGAKVLFNNPAMPAGLAAATRPLQEAVVGRVASVLAARSPSLPPADQQRSALVGVQIVAAVMPSIVAAEGAERAALITELKKAMYGYFAPLDSPAEHR